MESKTRTTFSVGDHVYIKNAEHPWHGCTGKIMGGFEAHPLLEWRVRLDGSQGGYPGQEVACASSDLLRSEWP